MATFIIILKLIHIKYNMLAINCTSCLVEDKEKTMKHLPLAALLDVAGSYRRIRNK
ncbi:MAG TPA: hypothetical protein VEM40_05640 [Nitrospirota bacterium]|nr:hypothetical protein [Nitrospirota bacterium]